MEEVDKIIVQSLKQIGCDISYDCTMGDFTPTLLVDTVSKCLQKIQPSSRYIPLTLPEGLAMAQRFSIATTLSSIISTLNYRADIGYQTFLYPNEVDVRKLLMFLIEKIPRDEEAPTTEVGNLPCNIEIWRKNIKESILDGLHKPWTPQFCRNLGNARNFGCSGQITNFKPHHNLIFVVENSLSSQKGPCSQHKTITVFQQTATQKFDLISTILHQNSIDLYVGKPCSHENQPKFVPKQNQTVTALSKSESFVLKNATDVSPISNLTEEIKNFKDQNANILAIRKTLTKNINTIKNEQVEAQNELENMQAEVKIHERACLVLDNPKENTSKLETLIRSTLERRKNLDQQWQEFRKPMLNTIEGLRTAKHLLKTKNVKEFQETIKQLEIALEDKKAQQKQLATELRMIANDGAAPRKEYINRILEFISNIRKQRNDIYKVLDDTRDLQKQLNSLSAQLQRQFCYTDDLLFQTAKHDVHSKVAYKLLATLHSTCNELVELVSKTGNVTNTSREIEVQIDREKTKNVTVRLQQITEDIENFGNLIQNLRTEIHDIENEISKA
ncbi:coiled-coil domain-containing protein 22 homolog [Bactrocera neohumeralis]|uniref:coiled-coil domain-containing protein 22 homolog n=1 Tax=Bactrocera neohumeralis TaxID=98809 RepID=UPI0021668A16|nr:coiled-coil domain-containing protein 22 homolog [Bactrocera neohumeralis]